MEQIKRCETDGGERYYETPWGNLPSVTRILRDTRDKKDEERLRKWRKKLEKVKGEDIETLKSSEEIAEEARGRGTLIHEQISQFLRGELFELPDNEYFAKAVPYLKLLRSKWYKSEEGVYHPDGYAGTLDLYAEWDGEETIIDFTTSGKSKRKEWVKEKMLQATAYALAFNWMHGKEIKKITCIVLAKGRCQVFDEEIKEFEEEWKERVKQYYAQNMSSGRGEADGSLSK